MNPLYILGASAVLFAASVAWTLLIVIPHYRETRKLKAEGRCTDCKEKLPKGDQGPLCGDCWAKNYPG